MSCPDDLLAPCANGQGETILLAEDDDGVRSMIRRLLEGGGYHVLEAANGREALGLSERYREDIDLLLADTVMPIMGGPQLAGSIREGRPQTKVLLMSGYADDGIVKQAILESGQPFLQKPFASDVLLAKVRETLEH